MGEELLGHVVWRGAISQIPNTWDKWGREDPFARTVKSRNGLGLDRQEFYLRMVQERLANGSAEATSFSSFLFPLVVFCFYV